MFQMETMACHADSSIVEDWHSQLNLLTVRLCMQVFIATEINFYHVFIWKYFYNVKSAGEHGTLFQLRNLVQCTNVRNNLKSDFNVCGDFLITVVRGLIVSAAMIVAQIPGDACLLPEQDPFRRHNKPSDVYFCRLFLQSQP